MSGRIIPTIFGKGRGFSGVGPRPTFCSLMVNLGTVMEPLGVSFHLLIEDQGLVEVDLSAILDPSDSNWFMLCPWAVSFFQKLCLAPFPPVSAGAAPTKTPYRSSCLGPISTASCRQLGTRKQVMERAGCHSMIS